MGAPHKIADASQRSKSIVPDGKITPADRRAVAAGVVERIGGLSRDVRDFPANIEEAKLQEIGRASCRERV